MSDQYFPLMGHQMPVDVTGDWGRAMLKDARHLAPEPCRGCSNLCLSRDMTRNCDTLHCKRPGDCMKAAPLAPMPNPEQHFVDQVPLTRSQPLEPESPCVNCVYRREMTTPHGGIVYCDRRESGHEHCIVRGAHEPSEYLQVRREAEERELDRELMLIESADLTDYGSF